MPLPSGVVVRGCGGLRLGGERAHHEAPCRYEHACHGVVLVTHGDVAMYNMVLLQHKVATLKINDNIKETIAFHDSRHTFRKSDPLGSDEGRKWDETPQIGHLTWGTCTYIVDMRGYMKTQRQCT